MSLNTLQDVTKEEGMNTGNKDKETPVSEKPNKVMEKT
jgi:hypothetical protein